MPSKKIENNVCYRVTTVFAPSEEGIYSIYPDEDNAFHSYWDTCREQFAKKFKKDSFGFFICVKPDHLDSLPNFILLCESLLEIPCKTKFYLTDMKNVLFLRPSYFWCKCYMRRSLFTMLCRQGIFSFVGAKFEDLLFGNIDEFKKNKIDASYEFARKTKDAITRFFMGYNVYVGKGPNYNEYFPEKHGWVEEFKGKKNNYIKSVLVCPENSFLNIKFFGKSLTLS